MSKERDPRIIDELEQVRARAEDGLLHPENVVAFARNPGTALHNRFTWDNSEAAEKYRVWEARQLIAATVTVIAEDRPAYRAYVSLSSDRANDGGYRPISVIVRNKRMYEEMLSDALKDLERLQEKYEHLKELRQVWRAAQQVRTQRRAKAA